MSKTASHVFLSYTRQDEASVMTLRDSLIAAGETVWWDRDITPGEDWRLAIRRAMRDSYAVVICLSANTDARAQSGIYPELADAIDAYREYAPGSTYLIPVKLEECDIPLIMIDGVRTLDHLQSIALYPDSKWSVGIEDLVVALRKTPRHP